MSRKRRITAPLIFLLALVLAVAAVSALVLRTRNGSREYFSPPRRDTDRATPLPTVIIDAGHGGEDGGAIGYDGSLEKDLNLSIALHLEQLLRAAGFDTRLTRATDTLLYDRESDYHGHKKSQDMAARLGIAEEYSSAVFVSIHMNSFPQSKYRGLQVYYSQNSPLSHKLALCVQEGVSRNLQPDNTRKIKPSGSDIFLLDKIRHPCILIECGFISNPEECALLSQEEYRQRLCMALCSAIASFIESGDTAR